MIKEKFKNIIYRYVYPYGSLLLIKLLSLTYRVRIVDGQKEKDILDKQNGLVYASWHQRFFPGITFFSSRRPIAIIISKSHDGDLIARAVGILGWYPIRGSSSKGGQKALAEIKKLAQSNYKVGHIVDGPQGPFGVVKPGLLKIAQAGAIPVVPTVTSAQHKWTFNSWDKFMIPKPFSRVIIRFGNPIHVPPEMSEIEFEENRLEIEHQLKDLYKRTDQIWDNPEEISEIFGKL